jgi:vacuolar-type H+-ATPase subunit H
MVQMDGGQIPPGTYNEYVESEQSLLEQIRVKEEELGLKISAAEQEYNTALEAAQKEASGIIAQYRKDAEAESDTIWHQTMETAEKEVENIRSEGEIRLAKDRERKIKNFSEVINIIVKAVRNG